MNEIEKAINHLTMLRRIDSGEKKHLYDIAISDLEAQQADRWILAHIELPIDDICASTYVTIKHKESGNVFTSRMRWYFGKFVWYNGKTLSNNYEIIAWKYTNLPEPYKEERP